MQNQQFYENITIKAVTDTVAKLLKYPFGFHGDTGIRDYLYARLHVHGGAALEVDDVRPGYSTLLLQSEHYTLAKYKNTGQSGQGARFDLALTWPPKSTDAIEDRFAERLEACFAFELGKNKALDKVIDVDMLDHDIDTIPGTSDISKLYRELMHHGLRQGWAIEFYDSRVSNGASIVNKALELCGKIELEEGKRLCVVFVGFSADGKHHVSSNHSDIERGLISNLADAGIEAAPELAAYSRKRAPSYAGRGWGLAGIASASVEEVFADRAGFADRIVKIGKMDDLGRASRYVNLSFEKKKNIAQIHPHDTGICLVLRAIRADRPPTSFAPIDVNQLAGYKGSNASWLDGAGATFARKGPAIAFLIPDEIDELDDNDKEWQEIVKLLEHAKTLA